MCQWIINSLSSLYMISNTQPKYYIPLVYNIQNKLINIISSHWSTITSLVDSSPAWSTITSLVDYHQLGRLVSESACERKDPGSNPAADVVDAARNTAWDLGKQPNNYRSNYPTQEWARRFVPIASFYSIRLQFIPGHRGVAGNEAADSAAKAAHLLRYRTLTPYSEET
ncbi:Ribonuclease H-like domain, partial [Trinorchestia longiramus]